jgi:hypothetical protein
VFEKEHRCGRYGGIKVALDMGMIDCGCLLGGGHVAIAGSFRVENNTHFFASSPKMFSCRRDPVCQE